MRLQDFVNLYDLLAKTADNCSFRKENIEIRKKFFSSVEGNFSKIAFDTRRINQENDYNPRRGLQYYHRSEPFISEDTSVAVKHFLKLKIAVDTIKEKFLGSPEWLDSYCRVLNATVDRTLRVEQRDFDYSVAQLDYLKELLYLRYRLSMHDLEKMSEEDVRKVILSKDEKLNNNIIFSSSYYDGFNKNNNSSSNVIVQSAQAPSDPLIDRLMGEVKATSGSKDVERSITITVRDKINDDIKKES